jgi:hypothetical protein
VTNFLIVEAQKKKSKENFEMLEQKERSLINFLADL